MIAVALLATAGVGFAALASTTTIRSTARVGTVSLTIESLTFQGTNPPGVTLTNSPLPSQSLQTTFANVAESDAIAVNITVTNSGTLVTALGAENFALQPSILACTGSSASITETNGTIGQDFAQYQGFYLDVTIQVPDLAACTSGTMYLTLSTTVTGTAA